MVSLFSLIIFFFILVVIFSAVALTLAIAAWLQKKRFAGGEGATSAALRGIEKKTDLFKEKAFNIAVVLTLFCITPFVVLYLLVFQ